MSSVEKLWFYAVGGEQRGPVSGLQFLSLAATGEVNRTTLVWTDGMHDWQPAAETEIGAATKAPAVPPGLTETDAGPTSSAPEKRQQPYIDRQAVRHGNRAIALACITLSYAWIMYTAIPAFGLIKGRMTIREINAWHENTTLTMLSGFGMLAAMTLFFIWTFRTTKNVAVLRGRSATSPAAAVYLYFIPVLNFWKPIEVMKNLDSAFSEKPEPGTVKLWWCAFWLSTGVELFIMVWYGLNEIVPGQGPDGLERVFQYAISGTNILSTYLGIALIQAISKGETKRIRSLDAR